jgi:hypothetical protein
MAATMIADRVDNCEVEGRSNSASQGRLVTLLVAGVTTCVDLNTLFLSFVSLWLLFANLVLDANTKGDYRHIWIVSYDARVHYKWMQGE